MIRFKNNWRDGNNFFLNDGLNIKIFLFHIPLLMFYFHPYTTGMHYYAGDGSRKGSYMERRICHFMMTIFNFSIFAAIPLSKPKDYLPSGDVKAGITFFNK